MADQSRRSRRRRKRITVEDQKIVDRVLDFYERDLQDRSADRELRLQRYAKYRMWTEGKDWPWDDASDAAYPDMMEKSLRLQDTLHNSVMTTRPTIGAKALKKQDADKKDTIDRLIDFQVFVEQNGEEVVGELADAFCNDGVFTAYVPWIKEERESSEVKVFEPIPEDLEAADYLSGLVNAEFPSKIAEPRGDGWDYTLKDAETNKTDANISFFTRPRTEEIEMVIERDVVVYDGPRIIVKEYDDVLYPPRAANLQMPSPSNPGGASHVILRDFPTVDEIRRLHKSGFYNIPTNKDMDKFQNVTEDTTDQERKHQKDDLAGTSSDQPQKEPAHRTLTRLMCFDVMDIDGDGVGEDVIFWVIKETKTLLKAKRLTEMFPARKPRRPFAESAFVPVKGRRAGISLLEMIEGLHDLMKQLLDQTVDSGTFQNVPFFFYRPSGSMKPEIIRLMPGEGYPLNDPQRDVFFPNLQNNSQAFGLNMITLLSQFEDKLTLQGDIQSGRVPAGGSSALRTIGGIALLAGQGEARPERILRRFFIGLVQIWRQIHEHNQHFLPKDKQILISGLDKPSENPYLTIAAPSEVSGEFQFDFDANVLNTSKAALQESLASFGQILISQFSLQLGISTPDSIYRWIRDSGKSLGLDPDRYINEPVPGAARTRIMAEEAVATILQGSIPDGEPAEADGAVGHLQRLAEIEQLEQFGLLTDEQLEIYRSYRAQVEEKARAQIEAQQLAESAQQFTRPGQAGRPATNPVQTPQTPLISGNGELLDETLPGAGGGAQ